jgi:hypothetical protein
MDDVLKLLEDGRWHDMKEIINNSRLHGLKVEMLMEFFAKYDFVELDKKQQKVKLTPSLYRFVRKIKLLEEKEAVRKLEAL